MLLVDITFAWSFLINITSTNQNFRLQSHEFWSDPSWPWPCCSWLWWPIYCQDNATAGAEDGGDFLKQIFPGGDFVKVQAATKNIEMPKLDAAAWENSKYHKGGFEPKMTKREAALILGVSPNAPLKRVRFVQTIIQPKDWGHLIQTP